MVAQTEVGAARLDIAAHHKLIVETSSALELFAAFPLISEY